MSNTDNKIDKKNKPHGSQRPGGRTAAIGQRIANCVLELLQQGEIDFSVNDLAEKTGIHRSTIYRRWPSREALLQEGLRLHANTIAIPNAGNWSEDLPALCKALAHFSADPVELAILRAMMQPQQRILAEQITEQWMPRLQQQAQPIVAAQQRGEINKDIDPNTLISMIVSLLLMQALISNGKIQDSFVENIVVTVHKLTDRKPQ